MKNFSKIKNAFLRINREDFVLPEYLDRANFDIPLPIGYDQTISQPTTVRMMLEWLEPKENQKILDIGFGSGWSTALLSDIVGPYGQIFATERIYNLLKFGKQNCQKTGAKNIKFFWTPKKLGLLRHAPYDRILVSAQASKLPDILIKQLKPRGKMVIPIGNSIYVVNKEKNNDIKIIKHYGFSFVPLIFE